MPSVRPVEKRDFAEVTRMMYESFKTFLGDRASYTPPEHWQNVHSENDSIIRRGFVAADWTTRAAPFLPYGTVFESAAGQGYPPQTFKPCVASFMDFLRQAGAGEEAIRNIGSRNAQALFRI